MIVDSPDTLVTFPDGSQMLAVPDSAYLFDYRKSLATTGAEKVTFLVDAVDHFTFLDKGYSQIAGGISFYAKKGPTKTGEGQSVGHWSTLHKSRVQ